MHPWIVYRELAQPGQLYSVQPRWLHLKIKDILRQCTYQNICKQSPLPQTKSSSNTCCLHRTPVAPFTYANITGVSYSSVRSLRTWDILIMFKYFMTLKVICLLRDCKFTIRDVCGTSSDIYDWTFCDNSRQH